MKNADINTDIFGNYLASLEVAFVKHLCSEPLRRKTTFAVWVIPLPDSMA